MNSSGWGQLLEGQCHQPQLGRKAAKEDKGWHSKNHRHLRTCGQVTGRGGSPGTYQAGPASDLTLWTPSLATLKVT